MQTTSLCCCKRTMQGTPMKKDSYLRHMPAMLQNNEGRHVGLQPCFTAACINLPWEHASRFPVSSAQVAAFICRKDVWDSLVCAFAAWAGDPRSPQASLSLDTLAFSRWIAACQVAHNKPAKDCTSLQSKPCQHERALHSSPMLLHVLQYG